MNTKRSPCIGICTLDAMGKYCVGCGRTIGQITSAGIGKYNEPPKVEKK